MIARVFLFIFIAINSQVLGDDFSKNWTSKIDFAKVNALRTVKSNDPLPPGYLKMIAKKIYEREELERKKQLANSSGSSQKTKLVDDPEFKRFVCDYYFTLKNLHHLPRVKKIVICNNLFNRLMKIISKGLLGKPSVMMNTSEANSSIVSTTSASRPSSTSSIITSTESSTTSTSRPNEVITSTTLSPKDPSQMQMVNDTELVSPSSAETMTKNDSSIAEGPPDMKEFDTKKISNGTDHSMIDASNSMLPKNESMPSKPQEKSPNKVKPSNPGATINDTTDVSILSSMETSPPIAKLTPKPSEDDLNTTDISNPAVQVPVNMKNITSDTPATSESPIQIPIINNKDNVNLTDSMATKESSLNGTIINNADKVKLPNPAAPIDNTTDVSTLSSMETSTPNTEKTPKLSGDNLNSTDISNLAVQVPDGTKNISSDTSGTPIQTPIMNKKDNVHLTDLLSTTEPSVNGTMINNPDNVKQPNPGAPIDNTTDVSTSSSMENSPPVAELTPIPSEHDLNTTDMSNPAVQVPDDMKNITSDMSGTAESSIQIPIMSKKDSVNLTGSLSTTESSVNGTMINNPDKDKQPIPAAPIDNTNDVSTSSSKKTSPPIAELTPKPTEHDSNTTDMRNPAVQVPDDTKNITSGTSKTSESPIQTPIMNKKDNVNLTGLLSTTESSVNGTMMNKPDKDKQLSPAAPIDNTNVSASSSMETSTPITEKAPKDSEYVLNSTDMNNPTVQVPVYMKNITSDTPVITESPIQTPIMNNKDNVNLIDSIATKESSLNGTMINNADKVKQPNPAATIDNTTNVSTSTSMETSPPISELTPKLSEHDSNTTDKSNPAVQVPDDTKNVISGTSEASESSIQTHIMNKNDNVNLNGSLSTSESSVNRTMINNPDKDKQPNPAATIDNTTNVSTSSSIETSHLMTEKTPNPSEYDVNSTDISNPAVQVSVDTKNMTLDTSGMSESPIGTLIMNKKDNVNSTSSLSTTESSMNGTMINNPDKFKQPNPAPIDNTTDVSTSSSMETSTTITEKTPKPSEDDLNITDISNPADQIPVNMKNITSDTPATSESSILTSIMNNKDNVNLTDSMAAKESSSNGTMINNADKVKQPNLAAPIDNTTDVSTSLSMETSTPITEKTPKPSKDDLNSTGMRNPAVQIPVDMKNITSDTPATSESPIQTPIINNKDNVNLTDSMATTESSMNGTMFNNPDKVKQLNPAAPIDNTTDVSTLSNMETSTPITAKTPKPSEDDLNSTDTSNPTVQVPVDMKNITSDTPATSESPIQTPIMNKKDNVNLTDSMATKESSLNGTMINNADKVKQPNPVATIDNTTDVFTSPSTESSPTIAELTPKPVENDSMTTFMNNPAVLVPDDLQNITSQSFSHLANHDSELQGTESSNISIASDSTMISSVTSTKDPPSATATPDASNKTTFGDLTPPPLSTNISLNSSTSYSPINQTSDLNPLIPHITSFNRSLEAPLVPGNLMTQITLSNASGPPISDSQIKSTLPPQPINSSNIASTTQTPMIPIVMTMISPINNNPSVDSSMRNESMPSNESSTMNPSDSTPIIQSSDSNPMIPNVPSSNPLSPESDSDKKPMTLLPPLFNSGNITSTTQVPMIPIVMTMTPQLSSNRSNDTSVKNESTSSDNSTTQNPFDSSPITQTSGLNPMIPNVTSSNPSSKALPSPGSDSDMKPMTLLPPLFNSGNITSTTQVPMTPIVMTMTPQVLLNASNNTSTRNESTSSNNSTTQNPFDSSPIIQTSGSNPMIPNVTSTNPSSKAPLLPGSDFNTKPMTPPTASLISINVTTTTPIPTVPIVITMTSPINNNPSVDSSMKNESIPSNESSTMNPSDSIPTNQTSDSNPMVPNVPSSNPSSPKSDSNEKPMTLPPPSLNSVNITSTTQIPIIPIVMTMSPQVSSHPIDDSFMKNESNASNFITTTTPLNSIPIDHNSKPMTPNEPSENLPSNPKNTSSTHSDPSQPLAVTPDAHGSGDNLPPAKDPSTDPFAISFIDVNNVLFEDPLGVYSPESSEASSTEDLDQNPPFRPQVVGVIL